MTFIEIPNVQKQIFLPHFFNFCGNAKNQWFNPQHRSLWQQEKIICYLITSLSHWIQRYNFDFPTRNLLGLVVGMNTRIRNCRESRIGGITQWVLENSCYFSNQQAPDENNKKNKGAESASRPSTLDRSLESEQGRGRGPVMSKMTTTTAEWLTWSALLHIALPKKFTPKASKTRHELRTVWVCTLSKLRTSDYSHKTRTK